MEISPESLTEETSEERKERERRTGSFGSGKYVLCCPDPTDLRVQEIQSRVACLTRPYAGCIGCSHANMTLVFRVDTRERQSQIVACPRWKDGLVGRLDKKPPDFYVPTEVSTCKKQPLEFCPSCPSAEAVAKLGANKSNEGWYGRWDRLKTLEIDDDD